MHGDKISNRHIIAGFATAADLIQPVAQYLSLPYCLFLPHYHPDTETEFFRAQTIETGKVYWLIQRLWPIMSHQWILLFQLIQHLTSCANQVFVIIPYIPHGRQSVSGRPDLDGDLLWANLLHTAGAAACLTIEAHGGTRLKLQSVSGYLGRDLYLPRHWDEPPLLVAPDQGGWTRVQRLARRYQCRWVGLQKVRTKAGIQMQVDSHTIPQVKNRCCLIIDDILSTGQTILKTAQILLDHGALEVGASVIHALVDDFVAKLCDFPLKFLTITDTILPLRSNLGDLNLRVEPIFPVIARAIQAILEKKYDNTIIRT
jgi:ribose-phosphate pyrophosphokinase